ncbi:unnamed protein product [Brachionus calyciflorus]|uniref:Shisa N-terminal domain-containing protein n=1 Tax=Brachionus calyciflorus TaxID=104777 RepID=A0A813M343_9BILA|nr:unnamed protein product [Brachionus calyciflorus]
MKTYFFYFVLFYFLVSICINDEYESNVCRAYLTKYGFLVEKEPCICCGGCFKRYCCDDYDEKFIALRQSRCLNNYNPNLETSNPIKIGKCFPYFDKEGNYVNELECLEQIGEFCSGSCYNRYCSKKEYEWLNQLHCINQPEIINYTSKTTTSTTSRKTKTTSTERITTTREKSTMDFDKTIDIIIYAIISIVVILLVAFIYRRFCFKRTNRTVERHVAQEMSTYENDSPPPYPGNGQVVQEMKSYDNNDSPPPYSGY